MDKTARKRSMTALPAEAKEFLRSLESERNFSRHTVTAYRKDLAKFVEFLGKAPNWKTVDHLRIRSFLTHLYESDLRKSSIARTLAAVRAFYKLLGMGGIIDPNPEFMVSIL